ncbi:ATP-binding protein [Pseudarthrobacter oxydans]|uniref:ATP-binding protein n=1 Tax=Pseudarthrobacter oxydans TaxID=1671 RepID=UPI003418FDE5
MYKVAEVFIPGGQPDLTYVTRQDENLDRTMKNYFHGPKTSILSISGPTKSGKTVLIRRHFPDAIRLSGGMIDSSRSFWAAVADSFELFTDHQLSVETASSDKYAAGGKVSGGFAEANLGGETGRETTKMLGRSKQRSNELVAREALLEHKRTVVIDDFHYIPATVQVELIRSIKDLVFDGVPFVIAAVPHRAYDVVRVEKEMTGRVQQVTVGLWSDVDLLNIPKQGFRALNLVDENDEISHKLAAESFASPQLMQQFCLNICLDSEIYEASPSPLHLSTPDWSAFFKEGTSHSSKTAFDQLLIGPRQRTDRKQRQLNNGRSSDIYGVVLSAIEKTGPKTQLTYEDLRTGIRQVLASEEKQPERHEVIRILDEMTKIARDRIEGEPVLEYDGPMSTLYIADPFFAFYLRHAPHELQEP